MVTSVPNRAYRLVPQVEAGAVEVRHLGDQAEHLQVEAVLAPVPVVREEEVAVRPWGSMTHER